MENRKGRYTCAEYREEMRLLALRKRLEQDDLTEGERVTIEEEIQRIETLLGMD